MPRLARKNIKVFAGSATNNGVFGSLQANNPTITSDVEQLQSLSAWGKGWNAATETSEELPPLEEIQGVEYVTTYQQAYIMQEGIPEWAATVTYYKGCLAKEVTSTGFRIYNSLTDNNTGNLLSDTSNWKKVIDSDDLYAFDSAVVHKTGNEDVSGEKRFKNTIFRQNPEDDYKNAPAEQVATQIGVIDKNNNWLGGWEHYHHVDGTVTKSMAVRQQNGESYAILGVGIKPDGTQYTFAPNPPTGDNSSNIATTAYVKNVLSALYPVGSIYIGTQNTCPLASLISGSQWTLVAQDRALWGGNGSNANTTIAAGLPNITGQFATEATSVTGAFNTKEQIHSNSGVPDGKSDPLITFDASRSNSIYGNSNTVQPPAYVVNVWQRIK